MTIKRRTVALTVGVTLLLWVTMYLMGIDPREQTNIYLIAALVLPVGMAIANFWRQQRLTPRAAVVTGTLILCAAFLVAGVNPLKSPTQFVGVLVGGAIGFVLATRRQRRLQRLARYHELNEQVER